MIYPNHYFVIKKYEKFLTEANGDIFEDIFRRCEHLLFEILFNYIHLFV